MSAPTPPFGRGWNLSGWIRRLGQREGREPPLSRSVQPVLVTGDHAGWTSPFIPPRAFYGLSGAAVASTHSMLRIRAKLGAGVWIVNHRITGLGGAEIDEICHVSYAAGSERPIEDEDILPAYDEGSEPIADYCTVSFCHTLVIDPVGPPIIPLIQPAPSLGSAGTGTQSTMEMPRIFVPSGRVHDIYNMEANVTGDYFVQVEARPSPDRKWL